MHLVVHSRYVGGGVRGSWFPVAAIIRLVFNFDLNRSKITIILDTSISRYPSTHPACVCGFPHTWLSHATASTCARGWSGSMASPLFAAVVVIAGCFVVYLWSCCWTVRGLSSSAAGRSRCSSPLSRVSGHFWVELPRGLATFLPTGRGPDKALRRLGLCSGGRINFIYLSSVSGTRPDRCYSGGFSALSMIILRSWQLQASDFLAPSAPARTTRQLYTRLKDRL